MKFSCWEPSLCCSLSVINFAENIYTRMHIIDLDLVVIASLFVEILRHP